MQEVAALFDSYINSQLTFYIGWAIYGLAVIGAAFSRGAVTFNNQPVGNPLVRMLMMAVLLPLMAAILVIIGAVLVVVGLFILTPFLTLL